MLPPFDRKQLKILPLSQRKSKSHLPKMMVDTKSTPIKFTGNEKALENISQKILEARKNNRSVVLAYGAHLIKNGLNLVLREMLEEGYITHLATNGAGTIHDWELAYQGQTEEDVRHYVTQGQFGIWYETGTYINLAILLGAYYNLGYGESIGKMIVEQKLVFPKLDDLQEQIQHSISQKFSTDNLVGTVNLWQTMKELNIKEGELNIPHPYQNYSILETAYRLKIPLTVHPGFGYDIIYSNPHNSGAAIGITAENDMLRYVASLSELEGGVYLSVGSAIMSPMIFEKGIAMVRNIAHQKGQTIQNFLVVVNDIQEGNWNWGAGTEPTKDDPAYYLRFCKSFDRMNAHTMHYIQTDNREFLCNLYALLKKQ